MLVSFSCRKGGAPATAEVTGPLIFRGSDLSSSHFPDCSLTLHVLKAKEQGSNGVSFKAGAERACLV
jgi:hypothetical protein